MSEVALTRFVDAARDVRGDSHIALNQDKTGVTAEGGRVVRWAGHFRSGSNRLATAAFADSLRSRYGEELSSLALKSAGLDRALKSGKPLKARQVQAAVQRADHLEGSFRQRNSAVADALSQQRFGEVIGPRFLANKASEIARQTMPHGAFVAHHLDPGALAKLVKSAVIDAGKAGAHLVTTEEASRIQASVIKKELETAHLALARAAEKQLDVDGVDDPASLTHRLLSNAISTVDGAQGLSIKRLSPDAREALGERLQRELINPAKRPRGEAVGALQDDASLARAADRVVREFVSERVAARDAVNALPIPEPARSAIADSALHEALQPQLALAFGKAYTELQQPLSALAAPQDAGDAQQAIGKIQGAMNHAIQLADFSMDSSNRMAAHGAFWQMMLAPGGDPLARAIGTQLLAGQDLSELHAGMSYFRHELATEAASLEGSERFGGRLVYSPESFARAQQYDTLMESLGLVVEAKTDAEPMSLRAVPNANVSDAAIAMMRNLGVPMPAPVRLNAAQENAPISDPTRRAVESQIEEHVKAADAGPLKDGVNKDAIRDFDRATYVIEGSTMPRDQEKVANGLRELCVGKDGELNPDMLRRVSAFANQGGIACAYSRLMDVVNWPDLAAVGGIPSTGDQASLSFTLAADQPSGDILLHMRHHAPSDHIAVPDDDGGLEMRELDDARSFYLLEIGVRFDAQTCEPALEQLRFDYALHTPDPQAQ
ncbi:MAG: hypothetical protein OXJ53_13525 [Gammaproteobacteria bacterium]|nr:hypothetical protein [Gammaproteobacteria bacterium]